MGKKVGRTKTKKVKKKSKTQMQSTKPKEEGSTVKHGEPIYLNITDTPPSSPSLQEAFLKFRSKKQAELAAPPSERSNSDPKRMTRLRVRFLEQCRKYTGVPYKKKYHKPGSPEYGSKLFLDCCGLVRRALRDLSRDFGFRIGPWNQAYMFDTLPLAIQGEDRMRPGDLVFISGKYYNSKMRSQLHNVVHVEVWLGEGTKTIGARWHRGKVQVFDSYKFESTSYHSMQYHFRSIDTWLQGTCKSFCRAHAWRRKAAAFRPNQRSVFFHAHSSGTEPQHEELAGHVIATDAGDEADEGNDESQAEDASDDEFDCTASSCGQTAKTSQPLEGASAVSAAASSSEIFKAAALSLKQERVKYLSFTNPISIQEARNKLDSHSTSHLTTAVDQRKKNNPTNFIHVGKCQKLPQTSSFLTSTSQYWRNYGAPSVPDVTEYPKVSTSHHKGVGRGSVATYVQLQTNLTRNSVAERLARSALERALAELHLENQHFK